jgi:hypothetical protein
VYVVLQRRLALMGHARSAFQADGSRVEAQRYYAAVFALLAFTAVARCQVGHVSVLLDTGAHFAQQRALAVRQMLALGTAPAIR